MIGTAAFEKIISNLSRLPSRPTIGAALRQVIWQFRADMNGRPLDIIGWAKPIESWKGRGIGLRSAPTALETSKENAGVKISDVGPPILVGRHSGEAISETGHFLPMPERPPAPRSRRDRNKSSGRQVSL